MTVTIRVSSESRDILNRWCIQKGCDMPKLIERMIEYGIRRRDQAFYDGLPKPSRFDPKLIRMKRSILPSVGKINGLHVGVYGR
jgi:hypothetical protein